MRFPIDDWQFWAVSGIALAAAIYLVRTIVPPRLLPRALRRRPKGRPATLTVSARGKSPPPTP